MPTTLLSRPRETTAIRPKAVDAIQILAQQALDSSPYSELRRIRCERKRRIVFLRGVVSSYFLKQLAQETVKGVDGVAHIVNSVEVRVRPPKTGSSTDEDAE